jgi:chromosome segregation ATPase
MIKVCAKIMLSIIFLVGAKPLCAGRLSAKDFAQLHRDFAQAIAQAQRDSLDIVARRESVDRALAIIGQLLQLRIVGYKITSFNGFSFDGVTVRAESYEQVTMQLQQIFARLQQYKNTLNEVAVAAVLGDGMEHMQELEAQIHNLQQAYVHEAADHAALLAERDRLRARYNAACDEIRDLQLADQLLRNHICDVQRQLEELR